jgi:RimJ/RimL family protein N-acetyltransferase
MSKNDLCGKLVRLVPYEADKHAADLSSWSRDSEYDRLLGEDPASLLSPRQVKDWVEKNASPFFFMIQTLAGDTVQSEAEGQPIGLIGLEGLDWTAGDAWLGIGLGERSFWGQGYGSDALEVLLRYAFRQLNLRRVSLTVFEYNPRAIHTYEKAGFQHEGRLRQWLNRDGRRWDMLMMGILRPEWEAKHPPAEQD